MATPKCVAKPPPWRADTCSACEESIETSEQTVWGIAVRNTLPFLFHEDCFQCWESERSRRFPMPDEPALREKAREAIRNGRLPRTRPDRFGAPGSGEPCALCGDALGRH